MALSPSTQAERPGASIAALAIIALMLTFVMGGWRVSVLMSSDGVATHANASEASLLQIIEPIVGAGNARVSVHASTTGAQTVLVLLNSTVGEVAPSQIAMVERMVSAAMGIDGLSADTMLIEYAEFAPGLPGRLTPANYGELLGFVSLAGLLGWIALAAKVERVAVAPVPQDIGASQPVNAPAPAPKPMISKLLTPSEAADVARRDPTRAAEVLRGWMSGKEDVA